MSSSGCRHRFKDYDMINYPKNSRRVREKEIRNEEILERVGWCQEIDRSIMKRGLKYFGHVTRKLSIDCTVLLSAREKKQRQDQEEVDRQHRK